MRPSQARANTKAGLDRQVARHLLVARSGSEAEAPGRSVEGCCWIGDVRPVGLALGRRRADSLCRCRPDGLTGFGCVARRRPRTAGVT